MTQLDWLRKTPIVSVMIATAMIAGFLFLKADLGSTEARLEKARDDARAYFVRNPKLAIDSSGALIVGSDWLDEARAAAVVSDVVLPIRMLTRSQAKLDELVEFAYDEKMKADPAWRLGVLDANTPSKNFFAHAFVHETPAALILCVAVLILAGAPLERSWGSGVFALFCIAAIPLAAYAYQLLNAGSGVPWNGGAGLAGALLGAYFIRGLGGHLIPPGWVLLPVWLGIESFVVRGFWIDDFGSVPWASLCAAVGFGAFVAGGLRLIGVESALESRASKKAASGPNPIISRAARLRSDGDPYQAFDLIQAAWRENPLDRDVAEAFFTMAVEVGESNAAAEAIQPSLQEALRSGDMKRALDYWIPISTAQVEIKTGSTAAVRLAEALLDAGHLKQAIFTLGGAMEEGVSPAQALRIFKIARDLDEDLACEAAAIALSDDSLDPTRRAELERIVHPAVDSLQLETTPAPIATANARVEAEHHPIETTLFPISADSESSMSPADPGATSVDEAWLTEQQLDPGALSAAALEEVANETVADLRATPEESDDVLPHWNDPGQLGDLSAEADSMLGLDLTDAGIEGDELSLFGESADLGLSNGFLGVASEAETDSDLTPLMVASDEITNPFSSSAPADDLTMLASPLLGATGAVPQAVIQSDGPINGNDDLPDSIVDGGDPMPVEAHQTTRIPPSATDEEFAIGFDTTVTRTSPLRPLRAIDAIPVEQHSDSIEIDVDGRGKSRLPFDRVEAIVVAGISGLAPRPILLVDFILNWSGDQSKPLKIIRLRSDRFDPRDFEPRVSEPLEALTTWVRRLQAESDATCLPSRAILNGQFVRYDSVEDYESCVLAAMRES